MKFQLKENFKIGKIVRVRGSVSIKCRLQIGFKMQTAD